MKLKKWASVAEIVSGVAVLITLVFLVLGIQDNTEVLRASAYADLMDSLNQFQSEQMRDPASLRVWDAFVYEKTGELQDIDEMRLAITVLVIFRTYEKAYFSNQSGLLGASEWERFERNICMNLGRARSAGMRVMEPLEATVTVEFMEYIDEMCAE